VGASPQNNWAYYNAQEGKTYVYTTSNRVAQSHKASKKASVQAANKKGAGGEFTLALLSGNSQCLLSAKQTFRGAAVFLLVHL
jgi:hypothetical protein